MTNTVFKALSKAQFILEPAIKKLGLYELMGKDWNNVKGTACMVVPPLCSLTDSLVSS